MAKKKEKLEELLKGANTEAQKFVKEGRTIPMQLPVMEGKPEIVVGLKQVVQTTSYAQLKDVVLTNQLSAEVSVKIASLGQDIFNRIRNAMYRNKQADWDNIRTYFRVEGLGVNRVALLYTFFTSKIIPRKFLDSLIFAEDIRSGNISIDEYPYESGGNTQMVDLTNRYETLRVRGVVRTPFPEVWELIKGKEVVASPTKQPAWCYGSNGANERFWFDKSIETTDPIMSVEKFEKSIAGGLEFTYTEQQVGAIRGILTSERIVHCLTGAGGTGKTMTLAGVVNRMPNESVVICSPTGAGAKRVRENGHLDADKIFIPAKTIHSIFYGLFYAKNDEEDTELIEGKKYGNIRLIVVDEASMADSTTTNMIRMIYGLSNPKCRILLVGDPIQLPPVGTGEVFSVLCRYDHCPVWRLTEVKRQSDPKLLALYDHLRTNEFGVISEDDFPTDQNGESALLYVKEAEAELTIGAVVSAFFEENKEWYRTATIISLTNRIVQFVNAICVRHITGRPYKYEPTIEKDAQQDRIPWHFVGCKVVFTQNDADLGVVNGDIGFVKYTRKLPTPSNYEKWEVKVEIDGGAIIETDSFYPNIQPAFATTAHKAQGSEYESVLFIATGSMNESRQLVYTALTRSKSQLMALSIGGPIAFGKDVPRMTILEALIRETLHQNDESVGDSDSEEW